MTGLTDFLNNVPPDVRGGFVGILGVVIGIVLDRVLQRWGKVDFAVSEWKLEFAHQGRFGEKSDSDNPENAVSARYSFYVQIFNNADRQRGLREICIEFKSGSTLNITDHPAEPTGEIGAGAPYNRPIREWTLPSRSYVTCHLTGTIEKEKLPELLKSEQVFLTASSARWIKKKKYRWKITEIKPGDWSGGV